jgi:hypothetical protein
MPRSQPGFDEAKYTFKAAFDAANEFAQYGSNAFPLFAIGLYVGAEDVQEFAAEALTDGPDDKKLDFCYLDFETRRLLIGQGYTAVQWGKSSAPANKAGDLNTAAAWLFAANDEHIPAQILPKVQEVRSAIEEGTITHIDVVYAHNCLESQNVENELRTVAASIHAKLPPDRAAEIGVRFRELGINRIQELFESRDRTIVVEEWLDVPSAEHIEEGGPDWKAIVTSVDGAWIRKLHKEYGDRLFSANFRDFLGVIESPRNINHEIRETAMQEPANFWVYNNGVTALTHELKLRRKKLSIRGLSIINGAQTSGALGETGDARSKRTKVLLRIVQCTDTERIKKIILYNNTQNVIRPADTRSNDQIQKRLREDFRGYNINYVHRRSSIRNPRNTVSCAIVGPSLCAFHGDLQTAGRNRAAIFNDDSVYHTVFPPTIRAEHVFLVVSLANAFDHLKLELKSAISAGTATELQNKEYEVLKYSLSKHFIIFLVGQVAEELMARRVADRFEWRCQQAAITSDGKIMFDAWNAALRTMLPHIETTASAEGSVYDVTRGSGKTVARNLKALLASLEPSIGGQFRLIRRNTVV